MPIFRGPARWRNFSIIFARLPDKKRAPLASMQSCRTSVEVCAVRPAQCWRPVLNYAPQTSSPLGPEVAPLAALCAVRVRVAAGAKCSRLSREGWANFVASKIVYLSEWMAGLRAGGRADTVVCSLRWLVLQTRPPKLFIKPPIGWLLFLARQW